MKSKFLILAISAIILGWLPPLRAAEMPTDNSLTTAQATPTAREVLTACVENRAETLPNPFIDVPANHWAFKAVLTMHYCGAFRQATPRSLIDRLAPETAPTGQQSQVPNNSTN